MDDLFQQLESSLSKIGSTTVWKRQIGDHLMWLSPISHLGQQRVTNTINDSDAAGPSIVHEMKRLTLSFSIVGIDGLDLTAYRDAGPVCPFQSPNGKTVMVTLDKYLYEKIGQWSAQFVDDLFSVYADLMSSHEKQNLAHIKFENLKSESEELEELERKAAALREKLGMPVAASKSPQGLSSEPFDAFAVVEK